jgi:hypothetical protein
LIAPASAFIAGLVSLEPGRNGHDLWENRFYVYDFDFIAVIRVECGAHTGIDAPGIDRLCGDLRRDQQAGKPNQENRDQNQKIASIFSLILQVLHILRKAVIHFRSLGRSGEPG